MARTPDARRNNGTLNKETCIFGRAFFLALLIRTHRSGITRKGPKVSDLDNLLGRVLATLALLSRTAGQSGTGHFLKMIHNGIEYGLMQAYAEGLTRRICLRTSASS